MSLAIIKSILFQSKIVDADLPMIIDHVGTTSVEKSNARCRTPVQIIVRHTLRFTLDRDEAVITMPSHGLDHMHSRT